MDKERQNKILSLSELLNKTVLKDKLNKAAFSNIAKQTTIFSFWDNIAGKKLSAISKPYKIQGTKLYITTKSPTVSQQISLVKNVILEKTNTYSKPLGITINELVLNYKNYDEITTQKNIPKDEKLIWLTEEELSKIKLDEESKSAIKSAVDKITFLNKEQKERFIQKISNNYRFRIYKENLKNK